MSVSQALFTPLRLGVAELKHRVALAPLTRYRADDAHVHTDLAVEYYRQRSSVPGTMLITEATFIEARAGGYADVPGIWSDAQVAAWKKIADVVHANGSFIYMQLWALGRAAKQEVLQAEIPGADVVSSGNVKMDDEHVQPRALTAAEIDEYVDWYARAAKNAVQGAGFDGVEIHGANGYLVDQFIQNTANNRTDEYGGSLENRLRFPLRVVDAVIGAVGAEHTGIRLSPWGRFQGMREENPIPTFSKLLEELKQRELAFVHLVEPRLDWGGSEGDSLDWARAIWKPRPLVLACGFTPATAVETAQKAADNGEQVVIAFGRDFISNPDLPLRIQRNLALTPYDRDTFYTAKSPKGYTDYLFASA
ncbi:FMN-linked oxidoreductase [Exidia glandulosa HHB12029]|uniref:FMN-linked oxidoreductase n=1 Tax=Exidia glandulosa HHB12029 TaxID=1314781 RepID=A0A165BLH7_EXIGL|nr:FMN-linked oxidoreductase [Exidia glandulosa HHB12029]